MKNVGSPILHCITCHANHRISQVKCDILAVQFTIDLYYTIYQIHDKYNANELMNQTQNTNATVFNTSIM